MMDEAPVQPRSKMQGTMVGRALREGALSPSPEHVEYALSAGSRSSSQGDLREAGGERATALGH
jgi:hypothetical protein